MEHNISFMEDYINTMERHAAQISNVMPSEISFDEMAIGGGTPLILPAHLLEQVFVIAKKYFKVELGKIPLSVETSPNQTEDDKLYLLKNMVYQELA